MSDLTAIEHAINHSAVRFCEAFDKAPIGKKFVFGANDYAADIARVTAIEAIVDDYIDAEEFAGSSVIRSHQLPKDALVVSALLGKPKTGAKVLDALGVRHISYFEFYNYAGLPLKPARFWGDFRRQYENHEEKYLEVLRRMSDEQSRELYSNILNFRLNADMSRITSFSENQKNQYFEDFLKLRKQGETFVDVGGFDGFTTQEFIKRCPDYQEVLLFEPDPENMRTAQQTLKAETRVQFFAMGLSDRRQKVGFSSDGSISTIAKDGEISVQVDRLDDIVKRPVTYLKMDIEGAESQAIEGAKQTIAAYHPRLAICVYHRLDDLWKIPFQILQIRDDYELYLRHYTEGMVETVMFFIPRKTL